MKKVGTAMYVHKTNISELLNKLEDSEKKRVQTIINNFNKDYDVVKYDKGKLSLIESPNWDTCNEPDVGNSYCFQKEAQDSLSFKIIKSSGKIYHSKWVFVDKDYKGFDIEEAKTRTETWNAIPDIKSHKSRIGNKTYWIKLLQKNNIPL